MPLGWPCLDRLHGSDADYWALAGLLALPLPTVTTALIQRKYKLLGVRFADSYKDGRWHIAAFAGKHQDRVIAPVIELGWDAERTLVEASRLRAVILDQQTEIGGSLAGQGDGSYFMRAKLPYGCWRVHHETFTMKEESLVRRLKPLWQIIHDRSISTCKSQTKRMQATARMASVVSSTSSRSPSPDPRRCAKK